MVVRFEPEGYRCPFCVVTEEPAPNAIWSGDIVLRNDIVTVLMSLDWWQEAHGNALVIPNGHYENVLAIPDDALAAVQITGKLLARAMLETYGCDGITFRQNNGPAGNQDVWHYHLHVVPRYDGDGYPIIPLRRTLPEERTPSADKLRAWFAASKQD